MVICGSNRRCGAAHDPFAKQSKGATLWRTIHFLRANGDAFPRVQLTFNKAPPDPSPASSSSAPPTAAAEAANSQAPIILSPFEQLHLVFDAQHQRLQSITLDELSVSPGSCPRARPEAQSHSQSHSSRDPWFRHFQLQYQGQVIYSTLPHSSLHAQGHQAPALTRTAIHQLLGPTYPGRDRVRGDGLRSTASSGSGSGSGAAAASTAVREHILSYPGLAFAFPLPSSGGKSAATGAGTESCETRTIPSSTLYVFRGKFPHGVDSPATTSSSSSANAAAGKLQRLLTAPITPFVSSTLSASPPSALSVGSGVEVQMYAWAQLPLLDEPFWVEDAVLFPGQGVRLLIASPSSSSHAASTSDAHPHSAPGGASISSSASDPSSSDSSALPYAVQRHALELRIGQTTLQDALCELGAPQGSMHKEADRMQIHHASRAAAGGSSGSNASAGGGGGEGRRGRSGFAVEAGGDANDAFGEETDGELSDDVV